MNKTIVHFEIPAEDVEKLKTFYEKLLGWKFVYSELPWMPYWMIHTVPTDANGMTLEPGINGGMYKKENEMQAPLNYIQVDDLETHIDKMKQLGGQLIVDKMEIPGVGWIAVGLDPEGNHVAPLQPSR
jgi:predicted enzyme related to lactoylglutathione lyase